MKLELVKTADVYADENNPRQHFDGIDEMAASFDLNEERPGEPFTPPIVVRDGGIYRIVDGERRFRALKKRKAKQFHANVCEDMDEALAMVAMVATDDKQPLTPAEKSRGVQMMLLLGVDPVAVDKSARLDRGTGRRVKRAMEAVGDETAAEDMSIDWLLAIEEARGTEFEHALINASGTTWPTLYTEFKREQVNIKLRKEFKAVLDAHGVEISKDMPDPQYKWDAHFRAPADLEKWLDECEPGQLLARIVEYNKAECTIYRRASVQDGDWEAEAEQEAQKRAEWLEKTQAHQRALAEWFKENWDEQVTARTVEVLRTARERAELTTMGWWQELTGDDLTDRGYSLGYVLAAMYMAHIIHFDAPSTLAYQVKADGSVDVPAYKEEDARTWCDLVDAAVADGYEMKEYETAIVDALADGLDALGGGADD